MDKKLRLLFVSPHCIVIMQSNDDQAIINVSILYVDIGQCRV